MYGAILYSATGKNQYSSVFTASGERPCPQITKESDTVDPPS